MSVCLFVRVFVAARVKQPLAYPEAKGGVEGFKPPLNLQKICIVCLQNILSKPCS